MTSRRIRDRTRRAFRKDVGATDPILVIAAIAVSLVLLIGGSFAVGGMISNAKNLNAQADLDKIATAETSVSSGGGGYLSWSINAAGVVTGAADPSNNNVTLNQESVGFTPAAGDVITVVTDPSGWLAGVKSPTGAVYYRSSQQSTTYPTTIAGGLYDAGLSVPTFP